MNSCTLPSLTKGDKYENKGYSRYNPALCQNNKNRVNISNTHHHITIKGDCGLPDHNYKKKVTSAMSKNSLYY